MKRKWTKRYTMMDELLASPTEPLPQAWRMHQLTKMYQGLHNMEQGENPQPDDWRLVSDAINLVETLVQEMKVCEDGSGLLMDAITAMAKAGKRRKVGGFLWIDA